MSNTIKLHGRYDTGRMVDGAILIEQYSILHAVLTIMIDQPNAMELISEMIYEYPSTILVIDNPSPDLVFMACETDASIAISAMNEYNMTIEIIEELLHAGALLSLKPELFNAAIGTISHVDQISFLDNNLQYYSDDMVEIMSECVKLEGCEHSIIVTIEAKGLLSV